MSPEYNDIEVEYHGIELDSNTRLLGTLLHLSGFLGFVITPILAPIAPLIFWLVVRENHAFLDDQGKEALNFQISVAIYTVASIVLGLITLGFGFVLLPILWIFWIVCPIIASIKANSGQWYRYPLTIRLVQ